jgi:hypothetical protein
MMRQLFACRQRCSNRFALRHPHLFQKICRIFLLGQHNTICCLSYFYAQEITKLAQILRANSSCKCRNSVVVAFSDELVTIMSST